MKGGLIVILNALTAFEQSAFAENIGWDVLINADEEIGSPASCSILEQFASKYKVGLVYEPAMTDTGTLAKNRKGSGKFSVVATGVAAHAGRDFDKGKNAICFLAEAICKIQALNGIRDGVTINIGKVAGGQALNIVPDKAVAKLDIRIQSEEDKPWFLSQMQTILDDANRYADLKLDMHGGFGRPVKKVNHATEKLFAKITQLAKVLDINIDWKDSGGCCDGNNLAQYGMAVIDTLGVRGGKIHSSDEYIITDSLVERSQLSTLLLTTLATNKMEDFV
jgi:glutamate carboxypeptidase